MNKNITDKCDTPLQKTDLPDGAQFYKDDTSFYRLASPLSARVEGHAGKISIFLLFAIIWTVGLVGITLANLLTDIELETPAIIIICVFACVAAGFLAYGVIDQRGQLAANAEERKLLKNCVCTDGRIVKCDCVERRVNHSGRASSYSYDVSLTYVYTDLSYREATGYHNATYGNDPEFYKGQYVMVAFNADGDSRILRQFKLKREDEIVFLKKEAERSDDDFDGLDGKLINRKPSEKLQSAELPTVWLWSALALFLFVAVYTVPMSVCVMPQLVTSHIVPAVIGTFMVYLIPAILTGVISYFLSRFFKGRNKLNRILKNEPRFTRGKIFASEKTYRGGSGKRVFYCYIDGEGGRHTEVLTTPYYRKTVQDKVLWVTVVYDKNGNSVPLH